MGAYQEAPYGQPRVRLAPKNKTPFNVQKEKEVLFKTQKTFIDRNQASTSATTLPEGPILGIPERFDELFRKKPT